MKKFGFALSFAAVAFGLSGCGQLNSVLNETTETHEFYRIYDVKTTADVDELGDALVAGMKYNLAYPKVNKPIVTTPIPKTPGRFTVDNALEGTNFSRLSQLSGGSTAHLKLMVCEDSPWTARATRGESGDDWDGSVSVCVFPYEGGYHVDMYGYITVKKGGFKEVVRSGVYAVMGDPFQWIEKSMLDTIREARKTLNAEVNFVEGRPKMYGTPWLLDPGADIPQKPKDE